VAEAAPERCFDPTHNHPIGGGAHWESGYTALLRETWRQAAAATAAAAARAVAAAAEAAAASGSSQVDSDADGTPIDSASSRRHRPAPPPLIAVESNAEAEMSAVGAYLTWLAFGAFDPHYTANGHFVNMFAAVNGGFFTGFGGTFGHAWGACADGFVYACHFCCPKYYRGLP
jgi:hypothetical protein